MEFVAIGIWFFGENAPYSEEGDKSVSLILMDLPQ